MKVDISRCVILFLFVISSLFTVNGEDCPWSPCPQPLSKANLNFTHWDNVLQKIVKPGELEGVKLNTVDYNLLANDTDFAKFGWQIKYANVTSQNFTHSEHYALWMNIYNYMAVWMIYKNPCATDLIGSCKPLTSITQIGEQQPSLMVGVWDYQSLVMVNVNNGIPLSLLDIEGKLRNTNYNETHIRLDSRLHMCISCASISCPSLYARAYTVQNLDEQMNNSTRNYLANPETGPKISDGNLQVTAVFLWYGNDFTNDTVISVNGTPTYNISNFLWHFAPSDIQHFLNGTHDYKLMYRNFNWDLNGDLQNLCSARRPCFPWWALVSLIFGLLLVILVTVYFVKKRNKSTAKYESINSDYGKDA